MPEKNKSLLNKLFPVWKEVSNTEAALLDNGEYGDISSVPDALRRADPNNKKNNDDEALIRKFPSSRFEQYPILEEMVVDPLIDSAMKMHLSNALSTKLETGEVVFIESRDGSKDKIVDDLKETFAGFNQSLNLNNNLIKWGFLTGVYGSYFVRPYGEKGKGITNIRDDFYLNPRFIREYEKAGLQAGFTHRYQNRNSQKGVMRLMEPWKFVGFKMPHYLQQHIVEPMRLKPLDFDIERDDYWNEEPVETQNYGTSLFATAYDPWMDLNDAILSLNASRRNAAKRDRFVSVNTGNTSPERAAKYFNMIAQQLQRKAQESARRSLSKGYVSTIDNHLFPAWSNGSGRVDIQTEDSPVDVSSIEDVNLHINRLSAAIGIDKSLNGWGDSMSGGLGEGGFFRMSIIAAAKANNIRSAMMQGIERLFDIHVALKYNKVFTKNDKPWQLKFNSVNTAIALEQSEAQLNDVNFATSVVTMMQMLDPEMGRWDFKNLSNWALTDTIGMDEEKFKGIIVDIKKDEIVGGDMGKSPGGSLGENPNIMDSLIHPSDDQIRKIVFETLATI